jgi:hypothetical protein
MVIIRGQLASINQLTRENDMFFVNADFSLLYTQALFLFSRFILMMKKNNGPVNNRSVQHWGCNFSWNTRIHR